MLVTSDGLHSLTAAQIHSLLPARLTSHRTSRDFASQSHPVLLVSPPPMRLAYIPLLACVHMAEVLICVRGKLTPFACVSVLSCAPLLSPATFAAVPPTKYGRPSRADRACARMKRAPAGNVVRKNKNTENSLALPHYAASSRFV